MGIAYGIYCGTSKDKPLNSLLHHRNADPNHGRPPPHLIDPKEVTRQHYLTTLQAILSRASTHGPNLDYYCFVCVVIKSLVCSISIVNALHDPAVDCCSCEPCGRRQRMLGQDLSHRRSIASTTNLGNAHGWARPEEMPQHQALSEETRETNLGADLGVKSGSLSDCSLQQGPRS